MNEQEFYRDVIQRKIVDDNAVRRAAKTGHKPAKTVLRRALVPTLTMLASLLLVFSIAMTIPSARAEVLQWFAPTSAQEYLSVEPTDRMPEPELNNMIVEAAEQGTEIDVRYAADEPYWREIGSDFSATLGDTIFDGKSIYITVDFDGLSGYPMFENERCPSLPAGAELPMLLAEKIEPEMVHCFFDDYANLAPYLSGKEELWNEPDNALLVTLEDGTELPGWMEQVSRPVDEAFKEDFFRRYGHFDSENATAAQAWKEQCWAHCEASGARAVAQVYVESLTASLFPFTHKAIADYIDEDGMLKLRVRYVVSIDHGEETETKLDVNLGTITVNMTAYQDMESRSIEASGDPIALSGDASFVEFRFDDDRYLHARNYAADLDGVSLRVTNAGTVGLLGVRGIAIHVAMPNGWSEEQKEAFARNVSFSIQVDGHSDVNYSSGCARNDDGSYTLSFDIDGIPFDRIKAMREITLTPYLSRLTLAEILQNLPDGSTEVIESVPIDPDGSFDTTALEYGTPVSYHTEETVCPEWTIILKVN